MEYLPIVLPFILLSLNFLHDECFENIVGTDVVELLEADTALVSCSNLADVVLEAAQRCDLVLEDHDAVTYDTDLCLSGNLSVLHVRACDKADVRHVNGLSDLCVTQQYLGKLRCRE